jgi:hypothetical protein
VTALDGSGPSHRSAGQHPSAVATWIPGSLARRCRQAPEPRQQCAEGDFAAAQIAKAGPGRSVGDAIPLTFIVRASCFVPSGAHLTNPYGHRNEQAKKALVSSLLSTRLVLTDIEEVSGEYFQVPAN